MDSFLNLLLDFYSRLNPSELDILFILIKIPFCLIFGLSVCLINSYRSFQWLRNNLNLYVGAMLPILGLVITTVIGSNIALSLGMIGALSIIRFRTPVRSSYELTIYFLLLTIGIAAKVDLGIAFILTIFGSLLLPMLSLVKKRISNETENKKILNLNMIVNFESLKNLLKNDNLIDLSVKNINENSEYEINTNISFISKNEETIFLDHWKSQIMKLNAYKENKVL